MSDKRLFFRTKLPLPLWFVCVFLIISTLTRLALTFLHFGEISSSLLFIPVSLFAGLIFDLYVALCVTLPIVLLMLVIPKSWRMSTWLRWPFFSAGWLFSFGLLYLGVTELYFFEEFNSRLNYVAVDYLIYPHEVFINLWETYPVISVLVGSLLLSFILIWFTRKILWGAINRPDSRKGRAGMVLAYLLLIAVGWFTLDIDSARVCDNRALNEITSNGIYSFVYAGLTNELDYNQYYARIDEGEAEQRMRKLLADSHTTFLRDDSTNLINRHIESDRPLRKFNIVLVLEESFGSNFVGSLHPEGKCLTPQFDRLAAEHGTLFTNIYATGNRTVRGIEATLASFPPIPGRSIVKRPGNKNLFTLSSLLKDIGYNTLFIYGGLSYFDNIGGFAANNGFDRVVDQLDFKDPIFTTIWGVCDEDLFDKSLTTFDSLHALDTPFFATLLTVSNHSPYTYPSGRIPFDPQKGKRDNVVHFSDYAIGKFIDDARSHPFFDSTLFVFVADHGARVYGSDQIPVKSYEIPALFYNPVINPTGNRSDVLGSQMDLAPTILDFLGIDYNSQFFGQSLISAPKESRRALMSHNRDVSLMRNNNIAVLGIQGNCDQWGVDSLTKKFTNSDSSPDSDLKNDAIAYYMVAYNMLHAHSFHPHNQATVTR